MAQPTPNEIAERAAHLRRFRQLALRTLARDAAIGGVIGALIGWRVRHGNAAISPFVAIVGGLLAGAILVGLVTGPTWLMAYRKLARGELPPLRRRK